MNTGLIQQGSRLLLNGFPVLGMPDEERAIKYFSLNPFLPDRQHRCPLECGYCICHQDEQWHHHPEQFEQGMATGGLVPALLERIFAAPRGQSRFPISLFDYSDPFLPAHRDGLLAALCALGERGAQNMAYITTKIHPGRRYLQQLKATLMQYDTLRATVFVSLAPLRPGYEKASVEDRIRLIEDLAELELPRCWYLRPLVETWFDEAAMWRLANTLLPRVAGHVILSGVVMSGQVEKALASRHLSVPGWDPAQGVQKQGLPPAFEERVMAILKTAARQQGIRLGPVLGHRRCGANGNYGYPCLKNHYCGLMDQHPHDDVMLAAQNRQHKAQMEAQGITATAACCCD